MTDKKKTRRATRYGNLIRGWDWRTLPDRLARMEEHRALLGISRTEYLERAIDEFLANVVRKV